MNIIMNHIDDIIYTGLHVAQLKYDNMVQTYNNFANKNGMNEKLIGIDLSGLAIGDTPEHIKQISDAIKTFSDTNHDLTNFTIYNKLSNEDAVQFDQYVKQYNDSITQYSSKGGSYYSKGGSKLKSNHEILKNAIDMIRGFSDLLKKTSGMFRLFTNDDKIYRNLSGEHLTYDKIDEKLEKLKLPVEQLNSDNIIRYDPNTSDIIFHLFDIDDIDDINLDLTLGEHHKIKVDGLENFSRDKYNVFGEQMRDASGINNVSSLIKYYERPSDKFEPFLSNDTYMYLFNFDRVDVDVDVVNPSDYPTKAYIIDMIKCYNDNLYAVAYCKAYFSSKREYPDKITKDDIITYIDTNCIQDKLTKIEIDISTQMRAYAEDKKKIEPFIKEVKEKANFEHYDDISKRIKSIPEKFKDIIPPVILVHVTEKITSLHNGYFLKNNTTDKFLNDYIKSEKFLEFCCVSPKHIIEVFDKHGENINKMKPDPKKLLNSHRIDKVFKNYFIKLTDPRFNEKLQKLCKHYGIQFVQKGGSDDVKDFKYIMKRNEVETEAKEDTRDPSSRQVKLGLYGLDKIKLFAQHISHIKQILSREENMQKKQKTKIDITAKNAVQHLCLIYRLVNKLTDPKSIIKCTMTYGNFMTKFASLDKLEAENPHMKFTIDRMKLFCENVKRVFDAGHPNGDSLIINAFNTSFSASIVLDILTLANLHEL